MSVPARYDFDPIVTGDTWEGYTLILDTDITGWKFDMWVTLPGANTPLLSFSTEGVSPNITITDAAGGQVQLEPIEEFPLPAGTYIYDLQAIDADDTIITLLTGQWTVSNDVTKKRY